MYLPLKRSLRRHLNARMKKQSYLHVKWEVVRISVSCHKVIQKHYLCFNVIWSNLRCFLCIPDNHTAPSAWIVHVSGKNTCTSRLTHIKRLQRISLTHAIWRTCKHVWAYAPRLDTHPIKEYLIKSGSRLSAHEEFWRRFRADTRRGFSVCIHCFEAGERLQMQKWSAETSFGWMLVQMAL